MSLPRIGDQAEKRGNICHNTLGLDELRQEAFRHTNDTPEIDIHDQFHGLKRRVHHITNARHTCIIEHKICRAKRGFDLSRIGHNSSLIADI